MTREEYMERMEKVDDWAPGWDAIDREFDRLYPGQEPAHYGTNIHARAIFGGDNYLDGYSVYESQKGYQHIVTYGMSELYANEWLYKKELRAACVKKYYLDYMEYNSRKIHKIIKFLNELERSNEDESNEIIK
nr:hypothetical protein [uncultured Mediterraneibacter sp.]